MSQPFSREAQNQLEALERQLAKAISDKEKAEEKYDLLFTQVFSIFDQEVGEGVPASYVCEDKYKLARQIANMNPVVNAEALKRCIDELYKKDQTEAKRIWNKVTDAVRTVNQDKLAAEIKVNPKLEGAVQVSGAIYTPERKPSRVRKLASKADLRLLAEAKEAEEATA